jgi:hypothetical protein
MTITKAAGPKNKNPPVKIREAARGDIPTLMALNPAAHPMMANDNVIWGETHLRSHLRIFLSRQIVAEAGGEGLLGEQSQ